MSITMGKGPALPRGREVTHGAMKVDILLTELDRGRVGWGGAEWALPLRALCLVTRLGEQVSFSDHCILCVTLGERIEVYRSRLLPNLNEQGRSGKEQDNTPFLCSLWHHPFSFSAHEQSLPESLTFLFICGSV